MSESMNVISCDAVALVDAILNHNKFITPQIVNTLLVENTSYSAIELLCEYINLHRECVNAKDLAGYLELKMEYNHLKNQLNKLNEGYITVLKESAESAKNAAETKRKLMDSELKICELNKEITQLNRKIEILELTR